MKKEYLVNTYRAVEAMQNLTNVSYEFRSFLNKFKKYLYKAGAEDILDELDVWQETAKEIALEYSVKDEKGDPIYIDILSANGEKSGDKTIKMPLPGTDKESDEAQKDHRRKKRSLLSESMDLEGFAGEIDKKHVPTKNENFTGRMQEYIQDYING